MPKRPSRIGMTAKEKKAAKWVFHGSFNHKGRSWVTQRDMITGKKRHISEVRGGKVAIRYGSMEM